jgi:TetR/AcrR family transcriptional regulator
MPEQPPGAKEQVIVTAARKRFAHYGFSKVTMDEIAADAGMGKASLYYYFPTKERLFEAVVAHEQRQFITRIHHTLDHCTSAKEMLSEYAEKRILLFRDLVNLSSLPFHIISQVKTLFRELFQNFEKEELKLLHQIITTGRRSGEFTIASPQVVAETILHAFHGLRLRTLRSVDGQRLDEDAYADLKKEMKVLVELVLQGLTTKTQS